MCLFETQQIHFYYFFIFIFSLIFCVDTSGFEGLGWGARSITPVEHLPSVLKVLHSIPHCPIKGLQYSKWCGRLCSGWSALSSRIFTLIGSPCCEYPCDFWALNISLFTLEYLAFLTSAWYSVGNLRWDQSLLPQTCPCPFSCLLLKSLASLDPTLRRTAFGMGCAFSRLWQLFISYSQSTGGERPHYQFF